MFPLMNYMKIDQVNRNISEETGSVNTPLMLLDLHNLAPISPTVLFTGSAHKREYFLHNIFVVP